MSSRRLAAVAIGGLIAASFGSLADTAPPAYAAPDDATITLTIERVVARADLDVGSAADFYVDMDIAGTAHGGSHLEIEDDDDIRPDWTFSTTVPFEEGAMAPLRVRLWDVDVVVDDHVDITTGDGDDHDLDLTVDLLACASGVPDFGFTGDKGGTCGVSTTTTGSATDRATVTFRVTVEAPDSDGDGLNDAWEINGVDVDGDGLGDVNLPAFGATWDHKDLFLELDIAPGSTLEREDIYAMKLAFNAAPIDAGTKASELPEGIDAKANPDGLPGITLHVDTGVTVDASAREGQSLGTCSDGIDNGGLDRLTDAADTDCSARGEYLDASIEDPGAPNCTDGVDNDGDTRADGADPDCRLGDNLLGGSVVVGASGCKLDAAFYATKAASFDDERAGIFRWGLSLPRHPACPRSGGWGELGGNDFMEFNFDGGSVLHEIGHTLNLDHGGFERYPNCKPNYVSGMNYDNQIGIRRAGGGYILDYGPPRIALDGSSRGTVPGPIDEAALDENTVLDASDTVNRYVYTDSSRIKRSPALSVRPNYNNDVDPPFESGFAGNVDNSDAAGNPADCTNTSSASLLVSQNDWLRISLPFRQFGDSADGAVDPVTTPEITLEEMIALEEEITVAVADLGVTSSITDPPTEILIGEPVTVTVDSTTTNDGPSSLMDVRLDTDVAASAGASASPASQSELLEAVAADAPREAATAVTLACAAPGTHTFDITSSVKPDRAGDSDPNAANNSEAVQLTVDCVVPVAINIKPGSFPNSVNRNSSTSSNVPVAVLTTEAGERGLPLDFNAATVIGTTARFGPAEVVAAGRGSLETHRRTHLERSYELDERTRDSDLDAVLHFNPTTAELLMTTVEGCVKGTFRGAAWQVWTFFGCDSVRVVK